MKVIFTMRKARLCWSQFWVCGTCHVVILLYTISPYKVLQINFLVAQMVKNMPAMQETWVQSLGQEDPLEKEMATHFSILAWRIPWTEELGRLQFMGLQKVGQN